MDSRTYHFVEQFLRLQNFETFQDHMAKLGIVCWIQPDTFETNLAELGWRGFYFHNGVEDDIGSYTSPHEAKTKLLSSVIQHCLDENIDLYAR